jgi:alpha-L-fucosidase 2
MRIRPERNIAMPDADALKLWYTQPATCFDEALPLGNGRLGVMHYAGPQHERLGLNEDTLWAGSPYESVNPKSRAGIVEARRLIFAGEHAKAQALAETDIMAQPLKQMPYLPAGDLLLDFAGHETVTDYRRELDLATAIARVSYTQKGTRFDRELFVSPVDQVVTMRLTANQPGSISFDAKLTSLLADVKVNAQGDTLTLTGRGNDGYGVLGKLRFVLQLRVMCEGGSVTAGQDALTIRDANSVTLLLAMATSFKRYDDITGDPEALTRATLDAVSRKSFEALRTDHVAEHQRFMGRVTIDLGTTSAAKLPTDKRIAQSATLDDPALAALYFQFGRYLLISCSRPGTQPANLQGIWNDLPLPPWDSKYTININIQMNYWPAEATNLSELVEPLFAMVEDLSKTGVMTAQKMYGASGWVCHHNTDLWRKTAPIDGAFWGMWPMGGAWLALHLWERYQFDPDARFLERAYPLLRGASAFFLDAMVEHPTRGFLVTSPSISPENAHHPDVTITAGPTMDAQIIRDLFDATIGSARAMGKDDEFVKRLSAARAKLPPNQIGRGGQLQEWLEDWDTQAPEQEHRHISHLYGLFPSGQIDVRTTPELAKAAKVTLNTRGDVTTGWAIAWRINCWARLLDGERAHKIIKLLLDPSRTYPNMFDAHPPFQIDGNFGGTSGITELLLQSHAGEVHLLPALPKAWPSGSVTGLRARGGFEVDIAWRDGVMTRAVLRSARGGSCVVRVGDKTVNVTLAAGGAVVFGAALSLR